MSKYLLILAVLFLSRCDGDGWNCRMDNDKRQEFYFKCIDKLPANYTRDLMVVCADQAYYYARVCDYKVSH